MNTSNKNKNGCKHKVKKSSPTNMKSSKDKGSVNRILLPFNIKRKESPTQKTSVFKSSYPPTGLSQKEKTYVINSCQARSTRYSTLKILATEAIRHKKIFTIYGSYCKGIAKALKERGWVEKIQAKKMNLNKIRNGLITKKSEVASEMERLLLSNMVEKHPPNFIWYTSEEVLDTLTNVYPGNLITVNRLRGAPWTTKEGLCNCTKENYWYFIENKADVLTPRTFNISDPGEFDDFRADFKITACTNLLKWILLRTKMLKPVFSAQGTIDIKVLAFALNRCKEYLLKKQHIDLDREFAPVSTSQWNIFMRKYRNAIEDGASFNLISRDEVYFYMCYSRYLLSAMEKYRPQLQCEGTRNVWILKPAMCSRGRGIRMASEINMICKFVNMNNTKYVVQKYIESPLLIYETKFDIRQYYLVTSTCPLVIWMYKDCYLKFSTQNYNLENYHESIHLTNNAVQKKYKISTERSPNLPKANMWDLDQFKEYLKSIGRPYVWENRIYQAMKKCIIGIMLSCQDTCNTCSNRFELYGCDFILDKEYTPWLIEINSHPDLSSTTQVTDKICSDVLSDIIKVVLDYPANSKAPTGKFECIYKQSSAINRFTKALDLVVKGTSVPPEYFCNEPGTEYDVTMNGLNSIPVIHIPDWPVDNTAPSDGEIYLKKTSELSPLYSKVDSDEEIDLTATFITNQLNELVSSI